MREHGLKTETEAAALLGCPTYRLKYLRETQRLPFQRIGREVVYTDVEIKLARILLEEKKPGV